MADCKILCKCKKTSFLSPLEMIKFCQIMSPRAKAILDFWFVETPSEKRFKKDEKFDQLIREEFLNDYEKASLNDYDDWQDTALGSLALVILFDLREKFSALSKT